jgi:N-acyl homoserine lactone hydrolase
VSADWRIIALDTGTSVIDQSVVTYMQGAGQPVTIPRVMWVLTGPETVVVDTSVASVADAVEIMGESLSRDADQEPRAALAAAGVNPEDVRWVILTHLHYDHCGNNHLFPRARFVVQQTELRYAACPSPYQAKAYFAPTAGLTPRFWGSRFEVVDGDVALLPGIDLVTVPGHSPGSQAVLVRSGGKVWAIAGDAVMSQRNLEENIPPGFHHDPDAALASMAKLRRLADTVLPSHDYALFPDGARRRAFP